MFNLERQRRGSRRPPRQLIGMSFRPGIPWRVALQQSQPPLSRPEPLCNHKGSSVEQFSADGTCLTDTVSQNGPQSTSYMCTTVSTVISTLSLTRSIRVLGFFMPHFT